MYWLDLIPYGTPTIDQLTIMEKQTYLDSLFSELSKYGYPKNSSDATREELNYLSGCVKKLKEDSDWKHRYDIYDKHLIRYFKEALSKDKEVLDEITHIVDSIVDDATPLLMKLKYSFNRPRPRQLAAAHKLKLFPHESYSDNSPSFPSGHVFISKILCEVIGNRFPESYGDLQKLLDDVINSRIYMGLHYQSDIDVALMCAEQVLKHKEFMLKYRL